jgi:hypothetical protein
MGGWVEYRDDDDEVVQSEGVGGGVAVTAY